MVTQRGSAKEKRGPWGGCLSEVFCRPRVVSIARPPLPGGAAHLDREKVLFATRHRIATTKEAVKDRAGYSYKKLVAALGREFK